MKLFGTSNVTKHEHKTDKRGPSKIEKTKNATNILINDRKGWFPNVTRLMKGCGPKPVQGTTPVANICDMNSSNGSVMSNLISPLTPDDVVVVLDTEDESTARSVDNDRPAPERDVMITSMELELESKVSPTIESNDESTPKRSVSEVQPVNEPRLSEADPMYMVKSEPDSKAIISSVMRPPRNMRTTSKTVKLPPMHNSNVAVGRNGSAKPQPVRRSVTENSSASLHRRQQPLDVFEFDTASLKQIITDDNDDDDIERKRRSSVVPFDLSLPKAMDASMRAVSAMTVFSVDGADDGSFVADDDDDDNSLDNESNAGSGSKSRTSPSPVSVVDGTSKLGSAAADWMHLWASSPVSVAQSDKIDLRDDVDSAPREEFPTFDSSATSFSMQYSCSTTETSKDESVTSVSYLPETPLPPHETASPDHNTVFQGWAAVSYGSDWVCNENPNVGVSALRYIQILPTLIASDKVLVRLSDVNGETSLVPFSASCSSLVVHHVSARSGNCLVLADDNNKICILPVHISGSVFLESRANDSKSNCERFFFPFKKNVDATPTSSLYAPDAQYDAVIHLRFMLDFILQKANRR